MVGAGQVGLAAAHALCQAGRSPVVLEAVQVGYEPAEGRHVTLATRQAGEVRAATARRGSGSPSTRRPTGLRQLPLRSRPAGGRRTHGGLPEHGTGDEEQVAGSFAAFLSTREALAVGLGDGPNRAITRLWRSTPGGCYPNGVRVYGPQAIRERNETHEIREYAPDWVLIGDDGGAGHPQPMWMRSCCRCTRRERPAPLGAQGDRDVAGIVPACGSSCWVAGLVTAGRIRGVGASHVVGRVPSRAGCGGRPAHSLTTSCWSTRVSRCNRGVRCRIFERCCSPMPIPIMRTHNCCCGGRPQWPPART